MKKLIKAVFIVSIVLFIVSLGAHVLDLGAVNFDRIVLGEGNYGTDPNTTADITLQYDEYIENTVNGRIGFGSANLLTTGTLGAGAATLTSVTSSGAVSVDNLIWGAVDTVTVGTDTLALTGKGNVIRMAGASQPDSVKVVTGGLALGLYLVQISGTNDVILVDGNNLKLAGDLTLDVNSDGVLLFSDGTNLYQMGAIANND